MFKLLGSSGATKFFFDRIGTPYRWLTDNPLWRDSLHEMARHFPPSGAQLKVLDVGAGPGNSALRLLEYRPDLHILGIDFAANILKQARHHALIAGRAEQVLWTQADALHLPLADNSFDAVTAHSVLYMLSSPDVFLQEAMRVLRPGGRLILLNPSAVSYPLKLISKTWHSKAYLSVLIWHSVSRLHRRYTLEQMAALLTKSGFARVLAENVVEGYGILSRGEKPYTHLSTVERVTQTSTRDEASTEMQTIDADGLASISRGRFVFLLVRQTPDKPVWALKPDENLRWQAVMVNNPSDKPYLLVFTSLSKAVEFMQAAITHNILYGISKVAKYDKSVAQTWGAEMLINPSFEALSIFDYFAFKGLQLEVDPQRAIIGEE